MRHSHGLKATQGFTKLLALGLVLDFGTTEDCIYTNQVEIFRFWTIKLSFFTALTVTSSKPDIRNK